MSRPHPTFRELSVGQVAERSGVAVSALHYYERHALIRSRRTASNHRRYARDTLRRVAFIRASQRVGIPLARIRHATTVDHFARLGYPRSAGVTGDRRIQP